MAAYDWIRAAPEASCLVVCAVAAVCDLRALRIPNRLTYPAFTLALGLHFMLALGSGGVTTALWRGALPALGWGAGTFLLMVPVALLGLLGMGDAKLFAVVGAFVPGWVCVYALLYTGVCGGVLALAYALARGRLGATLRNVSRGELRAGDEPERQLPYGVAIACGTWWAVLAHGSLVERLS